MEMFETLRKRRIDPEVEREISVIDLAVANGDAGHPEDAELTDFALKLRGTRVLPDTGEIVRLDARIAEAQSSAKPATAKPARRSRTKIAVATVGGCFVLAMVGIGVATIEPPGGDDSLPSFATGGDSNSLGITEAESQPETSEQFREKSAPLTQEDSSARVETRTTNMKLAVPESDVADASDEVIAATDRYGGYVSRSTVSRREPFSRASLELMIPAAEYQDALASISGLGNVRERFQETEDITVPYRRAESSLDRAVKTRDRLSRQRRAATTDAERNALTIRLRRAIRNVAAERQQLNALERQVSFVAMGILIVGDDAAANAGETTIEGAWRIAQDLFTKVIAALIVALAVLLPFAILGGIGYATARQVRRRRSDGIIDGTAARRSPSR